MTTVRFAPSPTGHIHIGNARTALFNWLFRMRTGGRYILRLDDTDAARSTDAFADAITEDLRWLGIEPDAIERQSARAAVHEAAADTLRQAGLLYPCYETADELERQRRRLAARRLPPVYDRSALDLGDRDRTDLEAEGRTAHWRFLLPNFDADPKRPRRTDVRWDDVVRGPQSIDLASMSDPVLVRADGTFPYTLPSVVDDAEMGVTHVIRGDDHVSNTAVQIALFEALGHAVPNFGHHNLLAAADGSGLSKRDGSLSLRSLREAGYEPMAVASLAVQTGMSGAIEPHASLGSLSEGFDMRDASRSAAKFDVGEIEQLNAAIVHDMPVGRVRADLARLGVPDSVMEPFWHAVRPNCTRVRDAAEWWSIVVDPDVAHALDHEDVEFVRQAFDMLPDGPWDRATWKLWTNAVRAATGRKGRALFMPLRKALTGRDTGPELSELLPLLGREGTLARRP